MLLQLAHLGVTNAFALLRLLPASDRDVEGTVHLTIPQADLAARRFERTHVTTYWNP
ncbi:hypothetical protein FHS29_005043 [Saccharothrix tamanrassetensis]|uniref:Uncharacterized protein n=1 Tax=Saccharothrix tamanrassetensis TaxID=1051531 RepID=A0A841CR19_9PSEU|nr:hypothetical protein [Saccharothrix tamanrassetensis]MBB5958435.1 hypothetical protein [Saccharothrix tamanrassetensis]